MTKNVKTGQLICLLLLITIANTQLIAMDCPDTEEYAQCNGCYNFFNYFIVCGCDNFEMGIMGTCMYPAYPCYTTNMTLMYDPNFSQYNIWKQKVAPFWDAKFTEAKSKAIPPSPLPVYLNSYNFSSMNDSYTRGWLQGYFVYQAFKSEIESLSSQNRAAGLFQATQLAGQIILSNYSTRWSLAKNFTNKLLGTNFTSDSLSNEIFNRLSTKMPCHECYSLYAVVIYNQNSICTKCPPNCWNCNNNISTCTQCLDYYYLKDSQCYPCSIANCLSCNETNCIACQGGFGLKNGLCQACDGDAGCLTCKDNYLAQCKVCNYYIYNYFANSNGICEACPDQRCIYCYTKDTNLCIKCASGYYSDDNYFCQKCIQSCSDCLDAQVCKFCRIGYGLVNGTCSPCAVPGCIFCDDNTTICQVCNSPYFQLNQTTNLCYLTNVTKLLPSTKPSQQVAICRPGCNMCYDNNTDLCFSCNPRYYMENKYCKKCIPGCVDCMSADKCITCVAGYVLSNQICLRCPSNCRQCSPTNASNCLDCMISYYKLNGTCIKSPMQECYIFDFTENNNCMVCMPGFTLSSSNKCIQCEVNCTWSCNPKNISQCTRSRFQVLFNDTISHSFQKKGCRLWLNGNCQQPEEGYQLYNQSGVISVKLACLYPCDTCNDTYCFTCKQGYSYSNGKCSVNLSCNPNCTVCLPGSERNYTTKQCVVCPVQNCGACLNGVCIECNEGYYLQGQSCKKCPQKCRTCYDSANCNICGINYVWPAQLYDYAYDCMKCDDGCLTCIIETNLCASCEAGKTLVGSKCINQYYVAFTYRLNHSYTQFMSKAKSQEVIDQLMNKLKAKPKDFIIYSIKNGSTIINAAYSAPDQSTGAAAYETLKSYQLQGFEVLGSSFAYMNETDVLKCKSSGSQSCPSGSQQLSKGAIAGIIVGSSIFVGLVIGGIFLFVKRNKDKELKVDILEQEKQKQIKSKQRIQTSKTLNSQLTLPDSATSIVKNI